MKSCSVRHVVSIAASHGPVADVIVVGAGSAGAAAARRLVDRGARVLLLEAGPPDTNPAIHDPARAHELWFAPEDWGAHTVPQPHADGRRLHWPRGKVLGGSSALNGMIWARGVAADYDHWAYLGNFGWSWKDVLPVYLRIEDFDRGASEAHGEGGPLRILTKYEPAPLHRSIVAAAQQAGIPFNPHYKRVQAHLAGGATENFEDTKKSMHNHFLGSVTDELRARHAGKTDAEIAEVMF